MSRRERQLSTLSCSLLLSADGSEERSGVSQRCVLLQAAQGDQTLFPGSDELLQAELVQILPDTAAPTAGLRVAGRRAVPSSCQGQPRVMAGLPLSVVTFPFDVSKPYGDCPLTLLHSVHLTWRSESLLN